MSTIDNSLLEQWKPPVQRKLWRQRNSFVVFQPFDILDALFPRTEGHLKRLQKRSTMANQKKTLLTPVDEWVFPMNKGFVSNLARIALILGHVTTHQLKTTPNIKQEQNPNDPKEYSQGPDVFDLDRVARYFVSSSSVHPVLKDIPTEAQNYTYYDWCIAIFSFCCDIKLTETQAYAIMAESSHIRYVATELGSRVNKLYFAEPYCFDKPFTHWQIQDETTQKAFEAWAAETERPMLQAMVIEDNNEDVVNSKKDNNKNNNNNDESNNNDIEQFHCSLPYTIDTVKRVVCSTCNTKAHIYCPFCLQWCVDVDDLAKIGEAQEQKSIFQDNYLYPAFQNPTPYHPAAIKKLKQQNETTTNTTSEQPQYADIYNNFNPPAPKSLYVTSTINNNQPENDNNDNHLSQQQYIITTDDLEAYIPKNSLPLPLSIDLMHHPQEKLSKSTGLHSCLVSPAQARIVSFPMAADIGTAKDQVPDYDPQTTVILYPTPDAVAPADFDWTGIERIIIVEATWQCTTQILTHPKLQALPKIKLQAYNTLFWRNQNYGSQYLATVEAIYYVAREVHCSMMKQSILAPSTIKYFYNKQQQQQQQQLKEKTQQPENIQPSSTTDITEGYQYNNELDDLMYLFLVRLYRVVQQYKNDFKAGGENNNKEIAPPSTLQSSAMPLTWKQGLSKQ